MNKVPFKLGLFKPIFRFFFPHELLVSGSVTPSHLNNQEVVDKPSDVQKKTRLSGITVKFQGRGSWNQPFGAPTGGGDGGDEGPSWSCVLAWQMIFHCVVSFIYYVFGEKVMESCGLVEMMMMRSHILLGQPAQWKAIVCTIWILIS